MNALAVEICPRNGCRRPLVRNHDELECLTHGLQVTPIRPRDIRGDSFVGPDEGRVEARRRRGAGRHEGADGGRLSARDRAILNGEEWAFEHEPPAKEEEDMKVAESTMTSDETDAWREKAANGSLFPRVGSQGTATKRGGTMNDPLDGLSIIDVESPPGPAALFRQSLVGEAIGKRLRESPTRCIRIEDAGGTGRTKRLAEALKAWGKRNGAAGIKVAKRGTAVYVWIESAAE